MLQTCCRKAAQETWARPAPSLSSLRARPACALPLQWQCPRRSYQQSARHHHQHSISLRKQLKDEAKAKKLAGITGRAPKTPKDHVRAKEWELTVGIEIHAQLNTARKLF